MKKATKQLSAIVLTLILCSTMLMPGFAAASYNTAHEDVIDPHSANGCDHIYEVYTTDFVYAGGARTSAYHDLNTLEVHKCRNCPFQFSYVLQTRRESHQVPCGVCGFVHS